MKSSSSAGPRKPALSEFWLSAMGTPWFVVRTRPPESVRTRSSDALPGLKLICGLPLPTFCEALISVSVRAETSGCGGATAWPTAGSRARSLNSLGFAALKGNAEATASVPACFAVAASEISDTPGAGPLAVERAVDLLPSPPSAGGLFLVGGLEPGFEGDIDTPAKWSLWLRRSATSALARLGAPRPLAFWQLRGAGPKRQHGPSAFVRRCGLLAKHLIQRRAAGCAKHAVAALNHMRAGNGSRPATDVSWRYLAGRLA